MSTWRPARPSSTPRRCFCRAVLSHADMHVFVFSYDEGSPFVASRRYPAEGLEALFD